ncbi:MAG: hypothetical protein IPM74_05685 [Crocinitomicaceae bacterium]|nr:hypothetical protein [Crocinitomicaceae bacterium]MBK8925395.1 hypothetical protein [Crocinitomicaceae bacterium]
MKYLIITGVFILGITIGYIAGTHFSLTAIDSTLDNEHTNSTALNSNVDDHDESDHHNQDEDDDDDMTDSSYINSEDSLMAAMMMDSTLMDENISTEKLIRSVNLPINDLTEVASADTTMQNLLGIEEVQNTNMFVEFWESPLNFEGYKLSRKKLVVYGLSPQFDYKIYRDGGDYFFSYQNVYYKMKETQDFLPFSEVSKTEVFND